jgi:hypothetical protein
MTPAAVRTNPNAGDAKRGLFVVHVLEQTNSALAGHDGCEYVSPPQPRPDALALVALLLGCPAQPTAGRDSWSSAIAGGRRTITLAAAPTDGRPAELDGGAPPAA